MRNAEALAQHVRKAFKSDAPRHVVEEAQLALDLLVEEIEQGRAREASLNEKLDRALSTVGDEVYDVGRTIDWILAESE